MANKIFFFHNPKAGGVSLRILFEGRFPTAKRCPIIENDKIGHEQLRGEYASFRGYDYYAGHYGRDIFRIVNDGHGCVTNFRDPVDRVLSLYNYFKFHVSLSQEELSTERFRAVTLAKSVSFEEFVSSDDPNVEVYLRNAHFRQLANSCWTLEITKEFEDVCRFVDEMRWYYVCEYPRLSVAWLRRTFGREFHQIPRANVTRVKSDQPANLATLDDRIRKLILAKNRLDLALYRYAVRRLVVRATAHSTGFQKLLHRGARGITRLLSRQRSELRSPLSYSVPSCSKSDETMIQS
jgi:Sulfotransferase family